MSQVGCPFSSVLQAKQDTNDHLTIVPRKYLEDLEARVKEAESWLSREVHKEPGVYTVPPVPFNRSSEQYLVVVLNQPDFARHQGCWAREIHVKTGFGRRVFKLAEDIKEDALKETLMYPVEEPRL